MKAYIFFYLCLGYVGILDLPYSEECRRIEKINSPKRDIANWIFRWGIVKDGVEWRSR